MPKKICNFSNCHKIINGNERYCEQHKKLYEKAKALTNKKYDFFIRHKRDKRYTEFYHSKEWKKLRDSILVKYKGLDLFAYFIENKIKYANIGHHIVELKDNWGLRLTFKNIFPVSNISHKKIHAMYNKDKNGTQKLLKNLLTKWRDKYG